MLPNIAKGIFVYFPQTTISFRPRRNASKQGIRHHSQRGAGTFCTWTVPHLSLPHVDDATDAVAGLHVGESIVDLVERLPVGDELVYLELASHVVVDKVRKLSAALDATEGASLPHTASNELECCGSSQSLPDWMK